VTQNSASSSFLERVMPSGSRPSSGVYENDPGSGIWYARLRVNGKLVRKSIGTKTEAIAYVEKARMIRRTGAGILPTSARRIRLKVCAFKNHRLITLCATQNRGKQNGGSVCATAKSIDPAQPMAISAKSPMRSSRRSVMESRLMGSNPRATDLY